MTSDPIGPAAVFMDDFLCGLSAEQADELRSALPSAWLDQTDAATRDAWAIAMAVPGAASSVTPVSASPEWLRLGAFETLLAWANGCVRTCLHSPDPGRPQPVFAAAWKPRLVVCAACLDLLRLPRSKDNLCDRCGHPCLGFVADDPVYPIAMAHGEFVFRAGVSSGCRPEGWPEPGES